MNVLQYTDLDVSGVNNAFNRTAAFLQAGDFRAADVKKLKGTPFYRAKLSDADRLLFRFGSYGGNTYLMLLEVIRGHAYEKSRFLNGAKVDESKLEQAPSLTASSDLDRIPLPYVNPRQNRFHVLDKIVSFDDRQAEAFALRTPLILIGAAGSGKTVLTLEKLKCLQGDVLYVTLSAYLADNARNLYYSFGYENDRQSVDFLSLREYVETLRVPPGRPITFRAFADWFARHAHGSGLNDAHMVFEEFNGVLTGMSVDKACLDRDEYLSMRFFDGIANGWAQAAGTTRISWRSSIARCAGPVTISRLSTRCRTLPTFSFSSSCSRFATRKTLCSAATRIRSFTRISFPGRR